MNPKSRQFLPLGYGQSPLRPSQWEREQPTSDIRTRNLGSRRSLDRTRRPPPDHHLLPLKSRATRCLTTANEQFRQHQRDVACLGPFVGRQEVAKRCRSTPLQDDLGLEVGGVSLANELTTPSAPRRAAPRASRSKQLGPSRESTYLRSGHRPEAAQPRGSGLGRLDPSADDPRPRTMFVPEQAPDV